MNAIYSDIWEYIDDLGMSELIHYMNAFPNEPDYNLVNYGEMRIYYSEIRQMFINAGAKQYGETYKRARGENAAGDWKISDCEMWEFYRRDVGRVARIYARR